MYQPSASARVIAGLGLALLLLALSIQTTVAASETRQKKPAPPATSAQIDVNRATALELTAIPGVGRVLAQRIVEFREKHGPFRRVEDLLKVKGIGEKSLEKLRPHVKVGRNP